MAVVRDWKLWLTEQKEAKELSQIVEQVTEAFKKANTEAKLCELLCENRALVLLSKPILGQNLQFTFLHQETGSKLLKPNRSFLAIMGFGEGTPVDLDKGNIHKATSKLAAPQFSAIVAGTSSAAVKDLPTSANVNISIRSTVVLVPALAKAFLDGDNLSPTAVMDRLLTCYKTLKQSTFDKCKDEYMKNKHIEQPDDAALAPLHDLIDKDMGATHSDLFYFMWLMLTNPGAITATPIIPATDTTKTTWFKEMQRLLGNHTLPPPPPVPAGYPDPKHATAMSKVADAWNCDIEREAKRDQDAKEAKTVRK